LYVRGLDPAALHKNLTHTPAGLSGLSEGDNYWPVQNTDAQDETDWFLATRVSDGSDNP
jgi:hypothetical protein